MSTDPSKNPVLLEGDVSEQADGFQSLQLGAKFFRSDLQVPTYRPVFGSKIPFVFQPVGDFDKQGNPCPGHVNVSGDLRPSNYYRKLPVASYVGSAERVTFPLFDPVAEQRGLYDASANPYIVLLNAVRRAARTEKDGPWEGYIAPGKETMVSRNTMSYFFQGLVHQSSTRLALSPQSVPRGLQPEDNYLPIIICTAGVGKAVIRAISGAAEDEVEPRDVLNGSVGDLVAMYNDSLASPERVDLDAQASLEEIGDLSDLTASSSPAGASVDPAASTLSFGSLAIDEANFESASEVIAKWEAITVKNAFAEVKVQKQTKRIRLPKIPWATNPALLAAVRSRYRPILNLLSVPSHEDQIAMLCKAFSDKTHILIRAFPPNSEYYTADVDRTVRNRKASNVGITSLSDDNPVDDGTRLGLSGLVNQAELNPAGAKQGVGGIPTPPDAMDLLND